MNKITKISILTIAILTIGMDAMAQDGSWKDYPQAPDNTISNPITISTPGHLAWLAEQVNNGNSFNNYTIILENSIDLSEHFWEPIGTIVIDEINDGYDYSSSKPFSGIFDGNGYTISHINIESGEEGVGLFGYIYGGTVKNLTIDDSHVIGFANVGGIVGLQMGGTGNCIENCHATSSVVVSGDHSVGGLIGNTEYANISNCTSAATVEGEDAGSIAGDLWGDTSYPCTVSDCYETSDGNIPIAGYYDGVVNFNITLLDDDSQADIKNTTRISNYANMTDASVNVTMQGRTLYKDDSWNTLCLPFNLSSFTNTPLEGAIVKTLESASFADGTLTLNFSNDLTSIEAGKPYIVKWGSTESTGATANTDIANPVFSGVTISSTTTNDAEGEAATFHGIYSPISIDSEGDNTMLYMGADNTLYYPNAAMTIGACRAYFQLADGLTCGNPSQGGDGINAFVLNFGEDATGMDHLQSSIFTFQSEGWFTLDGRRLSAKPTAKGLYIYRGRKTIIK